MQRLQHSSFKHKTAKACTPEQYGVPFHLREHFKKWRGTTRNFYGALRRTDDPTIRSGATANGVYRSMVRQRWAIILRYIILV